jgi:nucleotide-binding universal stress UspA family protein
LLKEIAMFTRILVPLDGSRRAEQAIPLAARIARASESSVVLMQAVWRPPVAAEVSDVALIPSPTATRDQTDITTYLARLAATAPLKDLSMEEEVADGEPAQAILATAQARQADLIVMASHGRGGLARVLLGSVAARVARMSSVPVLIVRAEDTDGERPRHKLPPEQRPVQVVVALDGSALAEAALAPAAALSLALSAPLPGILHLVRVFPLSEAEVMTRTSNARAIQEATAYLEQVAARLRSPEEMPGPLEVFSSVVEDATAIAGALVQVTARASEDEETDVLLALATHGRTGWGRLVAGSITERVLATTRWPVLVVHPERTSRLEKEPDHRRESTNGEYQETRRPTRKEKQSR